MRSEPICPRHRRSAVWLTFGSSPSLMIREPFGHLSLMSLRASRRPAEEKMSPSDCTDQVTTPPVAVSRVKAASCPQPAVTRATIRVVRGARILRWDIMRRRAVLTVFPIKGLRCSIEPSCRMYLLAKSRILPQMTGSPQYHVPQCSRRAHISPTRLEDSEEDHRPRRHLELWLSPPRSRDCLAEGTAIQWVPGM